MEWTQAIDGYCERVDPTFWSEPVNALTNLSFLIAALIMWQRTRALGLPIANILCWALVAIGVTSFLFHTFAQAWAAAADSFSIMIYALVYVYAANRHYWNAPLMGAIFLTLSYFPYSIALGWVFAQVPFFEISFFYWPLPLLIGAYAFLLRKRDAELSKGLAIGAGVLCLSLTFRSVDELRCDLFPLGTHFLWHILNGVMLGWMIEVYRRHMLATGRTAV